MAAEDYRVSVQQPADGIIVINVGGEVDVTSSSDFQKLLFEAADAGAAAVVVDLSATDYVDTTGLSALWESAKRCRRNGCESVIACPPGRVREALANSGLDQEVPTHDTLDEALRHGSSPS